jgi:hypothetical protein
MASGPETKLVNAMRKAAKDRYGARIVIIKQHGSQFSEAGVSDLIWCLDGYFGATEVKAPESYGGSVERAVEQGPTVKQMAFGARVHTAGGSFSVCATVEDFLAVLDQTGGTPPWTPIRA